MCLWCACGVLAVCGLLPCLCRVMQAARAAEEGKADPATRQAATEAFLAARESAKAQAQSEAQAAKAEKEVRSSPPVCTLPSSALPLVGTRV